MGMSDSRVSFSKRSQEWSRTGQDPGDENVHAGAGGERKHI
jgi:hypothetical protein